MEYTFFLGPRLRAPLILNVLQTTPFSYPMAVAIGHHGVLIQMDRTKIFLIQLALQIIQHYYRQRLKVNALALMINAPVPLDIAL
jgi:hypothetical protein